MMVESKTKAVNTTKSKVKKTVVFLTEKDLGFVIDGSVASSQNYSVYVRKLMQNWRQGTVGCKGRSDVDYSTKKPWKQKGTGRARAGSARSPLWRGGGVTFGPQSRVRRLGIARQEKQQVMKGILNNFLQNKKIVSLNWGIKGDLPKTSQAVEFLKKNKLMGKKILLFVRPEDVLTQLSFSNINNVRILFFDQPNAFDLSNAELWVFFDKDKDSFKEMVLRWT